MHLCAGVGVGAGHIIALHGSKATCDNCTCVGLQMCLEAGCSNGLNRLLLKVSPAVEHMEVAAGCCWLGQGFSCRKCLVREPDF